MAIKYTKELLENNVKKVTCFSDLVRLLTSSYNVHGNMCAYLKNKLIQYNIDYSHFDNNSKIYKKRPSTTKEDFIKNYLTKSTTIKVNGTSLKKGLFKYSFKENKCSICGLGPIWNNIELILQVDHIDGDNLNNNLDNLRILCPNCHTQTKTYAGKGILTKQKIITPNIEADFESYIKPEKNKRKYTPKEKKIKVKKQVYCICGTEITSRAAFCLSCSREHRKLNKPEITNEILLLMLKDSNPYKLAKQLNISDTAIRKRIRKINKINNKNNPFYDA